LDVGFKTGHQRADLPVVAELRAAGDACRSGSQGRIVDSEIDRSWQEREVRISIAPSVSDVAADTAATIAGALA